VIASGTKKKTATSSDVSAKCARTAVSRKKNFLGSQEKPKKVAVKIDLRKKKG